MNRKPREHDQVVDPREAPRGGIPEGYVRLEHGCACRCINFRRDENGVGWCCHKTLGFPPRRYEQDEIVKDPATGRPAWTGPVVSEHVGEKLVDKPFDPDVSFPFFRLAKKLGLTYRDVVQVADGFAVDPEKTVRASEQAIRAAERMPQSAIRLIGERVVREFNRRNHERARS